MDIPGKCVSIKPVDKTDDRLILVNMDRIVPCPAELDLAMAILIPTNVNTSIHPLLSQVL